MTGAPLPPWGQKPMGPKTNSDLRIHGSGPGIPGFIRPKLITPPITGSFQLAFSLMYSGLLMKMELARLAKLS